MRASILLIAALFSASGAHADTIFYTLDPTLKGVKFAPESSRFSGKYEAVDFRYNFKSPRDASSGLATGRRQHEPVTLTRLVAESSPQLFGALTANDTIKSMTIDVLRTDARGQEVLVYSIRLTNAVVVAISQHFDYSDGSASTKHVTSGKPGLYEDVSFVFQRIEVINPASKTGAMDDWNSPQQQ